MAKQIGAPVGRGGRNMPNDTQTVQYLLNCVPAPRGGPVPELTVDGLCGPKTMQAITKFQQAQGGFANGRVDPGGAAFRAMSAYDPYPLQSLPPSQSGGLYHWKLAEGLGQQGGGTPGKQGNWGGTAGKQSGGGGAPGKQTGGPWGKDGGGGLGGKWF
jgi:hypothetical protein